MSYVWDPDKAANNTMKAEENEMLEEYDFSQARRGPVVPLFPNKTRITIRINMAKDR
jgi:hypothetical protein